MTLDIANTIQHEISTILENTYMEIDSIKRTGSRMSIPQCSSTPYFSGRTSSKASLSSEHSEGSNNSDGRSGLPPSDHLMFPQSKHNDWMSGFGRSVEVDPEVMRIQSQVVFPNNMPVSIVKYNLL